MSAHDMSLLLDGGMDVDGAMNAIEVAAMDLDDVGQLDLFGDPVMETALDMPARAGPSRQLLQRLDELRGQGCCQGIAWSRQGTIASVSRDGRAIDLRFLRCRPDSGAWELSEPT